jgi:hypothetical protein
MATPCTLSNYLNGYPQVNGNHKKNAAVLNGPTDYDAGGVGIPSIAHVYNAHEVHVFSRSLLYNVYAVVNTSNPVFKSSDVKVFFIDVATGLQPADNTDLSAIKIGIVLEGTN